MMKYVLVYTGNHNVYSLRIRKMKNNDVFGQIYRSTPSVSFNYRLSEDYTIFTEGGAWSYITICARESSVEFFLTSD